jgi:hypothetical protein
MVKRKPNGRMPQPQHGNKSNPSRHDKRARLDQATERNRTTVAQVPLVGSLALLTAAMSRVLDARIAFRFPIVVAGAMLAGGRRTAASWFRCAGVKDDWDRFYEALQSIGKNAASVIHPIVRVIFEKFEPGAGGYWKIAIDDSPTKRFGPKVEAANIHHNPTPGPSDGPWLYGHNWVCLAMLIQHPVFGVIALPLLSRLYVRKVDVPALEEQYGWKFRTKHELALELIGRVMSMLNWLETKAGFLVVFDGAYAASELIRPLVAQGATVVTRLRRDAKLFDLPKHKAGQRGRPRIYGKNRLSLAKRANRRDGWQSIEYYSRGVKVAGRCKTLIATSPIVGGVVSVVILEHSRGNWAAYMSTDASMGIEQILQTVSDRWAIEEHFHDVKEVWGAGEQQVRNLWSNIGCWNLCGWMYTLVELECWDEPSERLVDRTDRPWDNPLRRPSHADRRRQITRKMLRHEFLNDLPTAPDQQKIRDRFERLFAFAA